jgi:hypothetical protein
MRPTLRRSSILATVLLALLCGLRTAKAQVVPIGGKGVKPDLALSSISVAATPSLVSFQLNHGGIATGSSPISITTTYGLSVCVATCTVKLYAYFASATAALSGGTPIAYIPSSAVLGQMPTGTPTSFTAFTQSGALGGAGASLLLYTQTFVLASLPGGSRTDALSLEINLSKQPQLPAATYTGVLYIEAQTF